MTLSVEVKREVLSIAEKNSQLHGRDLEAAEYIPPDLDEQVLSDSEAYKIPLSVKQPPRWQKTKLHEVMNAFTDGQLAFIGPAGSGKTTLVRRVALSVINRKIQSMISIEMVFVIDHPKIKDKNITGRDLLFMSILSGEMDQRSAKKVIDYAENFPHRILFVFDSIDTMKFKVTGACDSTKFEDKAPPEKHLGNFLAGRYLQGCRIITSGRNFILRQLSETIHPQKVVALTGLSRNAIKKIIFNRIKDNRAETVYKKLENELKSLMFKCRSPAVLGYTLCVIDTHDGDIRTLTDVMIIILQRMHEQDKSKNNIESVMTGVKLLCYEGLEKKEFTFTEEHLKKFKLNEAKLQMLFLRSSWGPDFKFIQKESHYFFTHSSVQESFASLLVASFKFSRFEEFVKKEANCERFWMVRQLLHGLLNRSSGKKCRFVKIDDIDKKRRLLYENDADLLKNLLNSKNPDYYEILEIFYCLYEGGEVDENIQKIIKNIEFKNLPISVSDAHVIGWVIGCCSEIEGISFWNCALDSSVLNTLETSVEGKQVRICSLNFHDIDDLDAECMKSIGNMTTYCNTKGLVFQECGIKASHVMALLGSKLENVKNTISFNFNSGEIPRKIRKATSENEDNRTRKKRDQLTMADRKNLRVDAKIERFMETEGLLGNLELSYLPLTTDNTKKVSDALIAKHGARMLKLRSSVQNGTFRMIETYLEENLESAQTISIHEIDISANRNLGEENTSALGKLLYSWKTESINLSECHCTAQEIEALTVGTKHHQISTMRYNNNRMSTAVAAAMANFAIQSSVQELHLVNCNLSADFLKELESNADKAKIAVLDLSYNIAMSSEGYEIIGRFVRRSRVTTLAFVGCETKCDELQSLQKQMSRANLASLDLSCNTLLMEGDNRDEVVEILAKIKTLSLKLAGCGLMAHDLQNIEESLAENQLEHLNIRGNTDLGEESIQVLVTLIRKLSLKKVDISNCGWGLKQIQTLPDDVKPLIENADLA